MSRWSRQLMFGMFSAAQIGERIWYDPALTLPGSNARPVAIRRPRVPWAFAATAFGVFIWVGYVVLLGEGRASDARSYFVAEYRSPEQMPAYLYSPVFAQLTEPLRMLGWDVFRSVWRLLEVGALIVMAGPLSAPLILATPVAVEVNEANINLIMPLAIIAGFRFPVAWAFMLLTKITPGIGLLWFAVRREWRSLGIALGVTAALVAVSFAFDPGMWRDWFLNTVNAKADYAPQVIIGGPLWLRLLLAAGIIIWAARTSRQWAVIVACWIALPATWLATMSMLVGLIWYGLHRDGELVLHEVGDRQ